MWPVACHYWYALLLVLLCIALLLVFRRRVGEQKSWGKFRSIRTYFAYKEFELIWFCWFKHFNFTVIIFKWNETYSFNNKTSVTNTILIESSRSKISEEGQTEFRAIREGPTFLIALYKAWSGESSNFFYVCQTEIKFKMSGNIYIWIFNIENAVHT